MDKRHVLIWKNYRHWRMVALNILKDHVDASVFAQVRGDPPKYIGSGSSTWLDDGVAKVKGYRPDTKALLAQGLRHHYRFLRAFHACRPISLDPYYAKGILPSDTEELKSIARSIFSNKPGVEEAIHFLATDPRSTYEEINRGRVFFCLTAYQLQEECGHYLLSGSEYLQGIAARIDERQVLRDRGKATLFECDVPMEHIEDEWIVCLAGEILEQIGDGILRRPLGNAGSDFGFWTHSPLLPENIIGVTHPTGIPNPHNYGRREE